MRRGNPLPDLPGGALLRLVPKLWPLLIVVLLGLGLLTISAYRVSSKLDDARIAQSDNTTWLIAQIEVDALKFALALETAQRPGAEVDTATLLALRRAADIYFSRIRVIAGHLDQPGPLAREKRDADWVLLLRLSDRVASEMDQPDPALVARADRIIVDAIAQCSQYGEVAHALGSGQIDAHQLIELGTLLAGRAKGREHDGQITLADLTGVAVQDAQVASYALAALCT